jgi:hypothetical protein
MSFVRKVLLEEPDFYQRYKCIKNYNNMKSKGIMTFITAILLLFFSATVIAQNPPPPPNDPSGDGGNLPVGGGAPVGTGLSLLVLMGLGYGCKKWYSSKSGCSNPIDL